MGLGSEMRESFKEEKLVTLGLGRKQIRKFAKHQDGGFSCCSETAFVAAKPNPTWKQKIEV